MLNRILGNLKTTGAGVALAVLQVVLNGRSTKQIAMALAVAVVGALSKD